MAETRTIRPTTSEPVPCWQAKACPFCGWVPSIQPVRGSVRLGCNYRSCGIAPFVVAATRRSALARWNRRAPRTANVARSQDNARIREAAR